MALRMILVGLVASLGFEPPSMSRIESWGQTGRDWVVARVGELTTMTSGPVVAEIVETPAEPEAPVTTAAVEPSPATTKAVDDLTFEVVVEGMAVQFGDQLAMATPAPAPAVEPVPVVAAAPEAEPVVAEAPPVVEPMIETVVAEAPPVAEPVVAAEAAPVVVAEQPAPAAIATDDATTPTGESRGLNRLTHAVTLTRQAFAAWANLIDSPVGGVVASRAMAH